MNTGASALAASGLSKSYGETLVLDGVDISLPAAGVLGLVGENGAGKSTLLNILSGLIAPDAGSVTLSNGVPLPASFASARRLGVARVFQEQSLVGDVPVFENLLIGADRDFAIAGQFLSRKRMIARAQEMVDAAGASIDVRRTTRDLDFSERQLVEIIRACFGPAMLFGVEHSIVLFDEPTASLERGDEEVFLKLVERLRETSSLLFVSHRLGEVLALSDRIMVLKDGRRVTEVLPADVDESELHRLMVGRERDSDYYHEGRQQLAAPDAEAPAFAARGMERPGHYSGVSLRVAPGEILGIGGLLESGKSALGHGLAGVEPPTGGMVSLDGSDWQVPSAGRLVSEGVGYIPAERLVEGMIADQTVAWNITLPSGDMFSNAFGLWRHGLENEVSRELISRIGIKVDGPDTVCKRLSGGNQQKVVLARWLARRLKVLILDNPTRGVDAGAKEEIYGFIRDLTDAGTAVILISDELLELIGLSNRIAIMRQGRITRILPAPPDAKPSEQELVGAMLSTDETGEVAAA